VYIARESELVCVLSIFFLRVFYLRNKFRVLEKEKKVPFISALSFSPNQRWTATTKATTMTPRPFDAAASKTKKEKTTKMKL